MSRQRWREWQIIEGGPMVPCGSSGHPWYSRSCWRRGFRVAALRREPICRMCKRNASSVVDHIKDFIDAEGHVSWALFSDPANHQALCANCHNELTSKYDSGFGNARKEGKAIHIRATGDTGVQFRSSSMIEKVNAALPQTKAELDDLLSDIPD